MNAGAKKNLAMHANVFSFRLPDETKQAVLFSIRFPLRQAAVWKR